MPYTIDVGEIADVALGGWFAAVPFTADAEGKLMADWAKLLVIAHLAVEREGAADFRTFSDRSLAGTVNITIKLRGTADQRLTADQVTLSEACSQQAVGESETHWIYRGKGEGTALSWAPPNPAFQYWGTNTENRYAWKGEIDGVGKLSYAKTTWDTGRYFRELDLAGPAGANGTNALANTVVNCFAPYGGDPEGPMPGRICSEFTLKDGRRTGRDLRFLGTTREGVAQVQGAHGAVWFAHGSFAGLRIQTLLRLARTSHQKPVDLSYLVGRLPLKETVLREYQDGRKSAVAAGSDDAFEGLSLWGLQQRGTREDDPILL